MYLVENVLHDVLGTAQTSSQVNGLDRFIFGRQIQFRDDNLSVRRRCIDKVLSQVNQRSVNCCLEGQRGVTVELPDTIGISK